MQVKVQTKPVFSPIKLEITLDNESDLFEFRQALHASIGATVAAGFVPPIRAEICRRILAEINCTILS